MLSRCTGPPMGAFALFGTDCLSDKLLVPLAASLLQVSLAPSIGSLPLLTLVSVSTTGAVVTALFIIWRHCTLEALGLLLDHVGACVAAPIAVPALPQLGPLLALTPPPLPYRLHTVVGA